MITDTLKNITVYTALGARMARAIQFIVDNNIESLSEGRHEIEGNDIYATVWSGALRNADDAKIETHRLYTDIQVVLQGTETFGWTPTERLSRPRGTFDTTKDIGFWDDAHQSRITLHAGQFAVFSPSDGHAPLIGSGEVRKCIIKVRN